MSSYLTFPYGYGNDELDYEEVCDVWCHCFREPNDFLRKSVPKALISVSDFTDFSSLPTIAQREQVETFDIVYVGANEPWKREAKNWRLAATLVPMLCAELGLRALVIGSAGEGFIASEQIVFRNFLPWSSMLAHMKAARILLVPNIIDASPRILAEALCLNLPVLVHRHILGGWKYVNGFTGRWFEDETDVCAAARRILDSELAPQAWFRANCGPYLAGKRLLALLRSVDPTLHERDYLRLGDLCGGSARHS
jgi:glycosyltransferase involved in cell wall biosynthesis